MYNFLLSKWHTIITKDDISLLLNSSTCTLLVDWLKTWNGSFVKQTATEYIYEYTPRYHFRGAWYVGILVCEIMTKNGFYNRAWWYFGYCNKVYCFSVPMGFVLSKDNYVTTEGDTSQSPPTGGKRKHTSNNQQTHRTGRATTAPTVFDDARSSLRNIKDSPENILRWLEELKRNNQQNNHQREV